MSYEGYYQVLCTQGHLWDEPENYGCEKPGSCPFCSGKIVFYNQVDQTNCDEVGIIPDREWDKLLISAEVKKTCDLGHEHVVEHARYRIPSKEEQKKIRYFWNAASKEFLTLNS